MYAPILTFRSPTLSVPYFSLDDIMGSRKRTLDQMLSGGEGDAPVRNPGAWRPPPHCLSRLSHRAETNVFAFEMKFVRESSSIENPRLRIHVLTWHGHGPIEQASRIACSGTDPVWTFSLNFLRTPSISRARSWPTICAGSPPCWKRSSVASK